MKKNYVNLELQIVDVQLSDCIAGSTGVFVNHGARENNEVVTSKQGGHSTMKFSAW